MVGAVFPEAWRLYRGSFRRLFATAAAVFVLLDLLAAIAHDARGRSAALAAAWAIVWVVATIVGSLWLQAALVQAVADARQGRCGPGVRELYRRTRPHLLRLVGFALVAAALVAVLALAAMLPGVGVVLFVVAALFFLTRLVLVVPVIVLEGRGPLEAYGRSRALARGRAAEILGVVVLTVVLGTLAHALFASVFGPLPAFLRYWLGGLVADSLVVPFVALAWTLTYYRLVDREATLRVPA